MIPVIITFMDDTSIKIFLKTMEGFNGVLTTMIDDQDVEFIGIRNSGCIRKSEIKSILMLDISHE